MPSEVGDYRKNVPVSRNVYLNNNIYNYEYSIDYPFNRLNSNSYIDYSNYPYSTYNANYNYNYNLFKPMNNNNEFFNYDKSNLYNKEVNPNANNGFRHMDSNELNKLNKTSYLFPPFGYKRSTSFGSIIDGKNYDNNINCDNNK